MNATEMQERAHAIAAAGGLSEAMVAATLQPFSDVTVSEGLVLGLLRQGVTKYFAIFGHGNTDLAEVLRFYASEGLVQVFHCRNEVAMAHAATALAWIYGETAVVLTSIGPGALQAFAGSLAAVANGIGVYHIYGDETTHGEGANMQQIPGIRQNQFGRLTETMSASFTLHTPQALRDALRRGSQVVHHPYAAAPFYLCLPINVQPKVIRGLSLGSLPQRVIPPNVAPTESQPYQVCSLIAASHRRIVIKAGGGSCSAPEAVRKLAERLGAVVVLSPKASGVLAEDHPLNMHVGGSKGTICGNFAMEQADLLIAIGTRAVCQSDCSGTGYPNAKAVININGQFADASHYNQTHMLSGDIGSVLERWLKELGPVTQENQIATLAWRDECSDQKAAWQAFKADRCGSVVLEDCAWKRLVLTQPAAIAALDRFANRVNAIKIFDAGDVQANGFQVVEDQRVGQTFTETGASYMGFAASALLAGAAADDSRYMIAFSGDGSFMMNPQILVDAVVHGVRAMLVIFDNRRMGAISSLQTAQYGKDYATHDGVVVDYAALASAVQGVKAVFGGWTLEEFEAAIKVAYEYSGLSVVHVPVYWGDHPLGGMGAYGSWNVGPWCADVEHRYTEQHI
jgi:3D-(3,5/4)-trihydroxycyclohexane-1,2-dione acylhydrolase (decyclizing)